MYVQAQSGSESNMSTASSVGAGVNSDKETDSVSGYQSTPEKLDKSDDRKNRKRKGINTVNKSYCCTVGMNRNVCDAVDDPKAFRVIFYCLQLWCVGFIYISDFQPVFPGKLVFRERSSGVPQEIW